jgi:hypothetical protein
LFFTKELIRFDESLLGGSGLGIGYELLHEMIDDRLSEAVAGGRIIPSFGDQRPHGLRRVFLSKDFTDSPNDFFRTVGVDQLSENPALVVHQRIPADICDAELFKDHAGAGLL